MEVIFINSDNFLKSFDKSKLEVFLKEKDFKSQERAMQFALGRFLIYTAAQNRYGIQNPKIEVKDKKPCLACNSIQFSLSHSNNIIIAVFDDCSVGADIEEIKERDFEKLYQRYNLPQEKQNKRDFYRFWTNLEAEIKLKNRPRSRFYFKFDKKYMLALVSAKKTDKSEISFHELTADLKIITANDRFN